MSFAGPNSIFADDGSLVTAVQDRLRVLTQQQKARWLYDAFKIPHLRWVHVLREWQSHVAASGNRSGGDFLMVDGPVEYESSLDSYQDSEESLEQSLSIPLSSEVLKSTEHWLALWKWLPEWITHREPQCLFSSSQHGYKYVADKCKHASWWLSLCIHNVLVLWAYI